jgi:hypothetical protein
MHLVTPMDGYSPWRIKGIPIDIVTRVSRFEPVLHECSF